MTMTEADTTFGDGVVLLQRREGSHRDAQPSEPAQRLSKATWAGLGEAVRAAEADRASACRLRGAGERAFSAGADIKEFDDARHRGDATAHQDTVRGCLAAIERPPSH